MPVGEYRHRTDRTGGAHEQALLTAEVVAGLFGDGRSLDVAHARAYAGEHRFHAGVLHRRGAAHESDFLVAFYRLDGIHKVGSVNEFRVGHFAALEGVDKRMRHRRRAEQA